MRAVRVDAHQHFWDLSSGLYDWPTAAEGPIFRSFGPADLEPELEASGIDATVLVQATDSLADTDSMLELASLHSFVAGVVGWVPLAEPDAAESELAKRAGRLCGVRHLIHWEPDPEWLLRPAVQPGLALLEKLGLPFDIVAVFPNHLRIVPTIAARHPDLVVVIDHLAKPPYRAAGWETWVRELQAAAKHPNVYAKVSGLDTAAGPGWSRVELQPAVDVALAAFGPARLLFGSDWPVCRLVSSYRESVSLGDALLAGLTARERAAIMGETAARLYRLEVPAGQRVGG